MLLNVSSKPEQLQYDISGEVVKAVKGRSYVKSMAQWALNRTDFFSTFMTVCTLIIVPCVLSTEM